MKQNLPVLVTGGAGYLGCRVVARLLAYGYSVRVFDRLHYGGEPLRAFTAFPGFSIVQGDIRDAEALGRAMHGVSALVHLAAVVGEPACQVDPAFSWSINHDAVPGLLDAAREAKLSQALLISTCSNYGLLDPSQEASEDTPLNPLSQYAKAKVAVEQMALAASGIPSVTVLRLATLCGLSPRMRFDLLVNEMGRDAALGREIEIYTPAAWRPFLHIDDAAAAILQVLESKRPGNRQVFNVVGENWQKSGLVELVRTLYPNLQVRVVQTQPDQRDYRVSGARFASTFGFKPAHGVADALKEIGAAVREGWFHNPQWPGHSAVPLGGKWPGRSNGAVR